MAVILVCERLRQEKDRFVATLVYKERACLKNKEEGEDKYWLLYGVTSS